MDKTMQLIEALMEDAEYKSILDSFMKDGGFSKEDAISMLIALSYIETGRSEQARDILASLEKNNSDKGAFLYYRGLCLYTIATESENSEEKILMLADAKSNLLAAADRGLYGEMGENAVKIMMMIEDSLDEMLSEEI